MDHKWLALAREASSAAEHLGFGVTALSQANYAYEAYYVQAFFSLSVGFERSGKLAFVIDHAITHDGQFPTGRQLRRLGHDIGQLIEVMVQIAKRRGVKASVPASPIHLGIVQTLSEFATNVTRYYNLETLAAEEGQELGADPIAMWDERVTALVLEKHYSSARKARDEARAQMIDDMIGPFTFVRHHTETGEAIDSAYAGSLRTAKTEFARRWERLYVLQIVRFIAEVLIALSYHGMDAGLNMPFLSEFFGIYRNDDAYLRSRRRWSIYKL